MSNSKTICGEIIQNDPKWLKYCSRSYREKFRERISERELEEQRKQLFNAYKPKISGGGLDRRTKYLVHNPDIPGTLTLEVRRLVVKRIQNMQEWVDERKKKERVGWREEKKLISSFWSKG